MMRLVRKIGAAAALVAGLGCGCEAWAAVIPSRAALSTILGGGGTTEGFESFTLTSGTATNTDATHLDSTTIVHGISPPSTQGPGLVVPGLSFDFGGSSLQWNGANYFSLPTKDIDSFAGTSITINFLQPTTVFGVDLFAFAGNADTAMATVFNTQGSVINTSTGLSLAGAPASTFFGYQDAGGIGKVVFTSGIRPYSPIIDNVTFGNAAVPEPSSLVLVGIGSLAAVALVRVRRTRPAA